MKPNPIENVRTVLEQQPEAELQALGPLSVGDFRVYPGLSERLSSILSSSHVAVDPMIFTMLSNLELLRGVLEHMRSRPKTGESPAAGRFNRLLADWQQFKAENTTTSSLTELFISSPYQQIIGMGEDALPFILDELRRQPDHWFWALRAITGDDPVKPEHRGRLQEMSEDWLDWASTRRR